MTRRVLPLLAAVAIAACAAPAEPARDPEDSGPARPSAAGTEVVAEQQNLEQPVVLDALPDGLILRDLFYNPPPPEYEPFRATLYGDPELADTLDGPVLLVGTSSGDANIGGPPEGPPGDREVDLGGRNGWVVREADRTWVASWDIERDAVQYVVGRGVSEDQLIAAAAGADFRGEAASLAPADVPEGLSPLIAGNPQDGPYAGPAGEWFVLSGEESAVYVSAVRAEPRLAALWGFWTDDAAGTLVRGRPGSMGELHGSRYGDGGRAYVWAEDGLVLSVVGSGDGERFVAEVVEGLRPGTLADLEAMRRSSLDREPTAKDVGCSEGTPIVSGVDGDLRWGVGVDVGSDGTNGSSCLRLITLDGAPNAGSGSFTLPSVGQLGVTSVSTGEGVATFGSDVLIGGVAPPGTARVAIRDGNGVTVDAVLAEPGPRPGEKLFGAFIRAVPVAMNGPRLVVTAYDAAGTILDTDP